MLLNLPTSAAYAGLFGDPELAAVLSEAEDVAGLIRVERALARAEGQAGAIPADAATVIDSELREFALNPAALGPGTAAAGVPVPALVAALRRALPEAAGHWLHWGATSQDIVDCAMVLQLARCLEIAEERLGRLIGILRRESETHAETVMAARTRGQVATPITFGLKLAQWALPLIDAEAELPALRRAVLRVQFGGASGANSAVAPFGPAVSGALARELGLHDSPPWHVNRTPVLKFAAWQGSLAVALAKMGADLVLLGRSEIGEVRAGEGGGSSTMPQKANPVGAEALVTLGRLATVFNGGLAAAAVPLEERDGAAWAVEWSLLPQVILATGAALNHALAVAESLRPDPEAMQRTLAANAGVMAEAASFALAARVSRPEAQAAVKAALGDEGGLAAGLRYSYPDVDWAQVLDPTSVVPACRAEAERIFAHRGVRS